MSLRNLFVLFNQKPKHNNKKPPEVLDQKKSIQTIENVEDYIELYNEKAYLGDERCDDLIHLSDSLLSIKVKFSDHKFISIKDKFSDNKLVLEDHQAYEEDTVLSELYKKFSALNSEVEKQQLIDTTFRNLIEFLNLIPNKNALTKFKKVFGDFQPYAQRAEKIYYYLQEIRRSKWDRMFSKLDDYQCQISSVDELIDFVTYFPSRRDSLITALVYTEGRYKFETIVTKEEELQKFKEFVSQTKDILVSIDKHFLYKRDASTIVEEAESLYNFLHPSEDDQQEACKKRMGM